MAFGDRRLVDEFLTNVATGWGLNQDLFIARNLLHKITCNKEKVEYPTFQKEQLIAYGKSFLSVGPGAEPKFVDLAFGKETASLSEYALGTKVFKRELEESTIRNLEQKKTVLVTKGMELFKEKYLADLFQDNTNYDVSNVNTLDNSGAGKYKWSHANAAPLVNIQAGIDEVREDTGMLPDIIVFGYDSAALLALSEDVQRLGIAAGQAAAPFLTPLQAVEKVKQYFGFKEAYIGLTQYSTSVTGTLTNIWDDMCMLALKGDQSDEETQKFGFDFSKRGRPQMQKEYIPLSDNTMAIMIRDIWSEAIASWDAAYLIEDTK